MSQQLPLELPAREARGRDDFFVSPSNAEAVAAIESWTDWPLGKLVLAGPEGSGKSHLAHVWAGLTGAEIVAAAALDEATLPALAAQGVAVEDVPHIAGTPQETTLFHLHNMALAEGVPLLLTGAGRPARWGLRLADLQSRIEGTRLVTIAPPDDALLTQLLAKLFTDRQIEPDPSLLTYLTPRIERSFAAAAAFVAALDRAALAAKRPVTMRLARELLDNPET